MGERGLELWVGRLEIRAERPIQFGSGEAANFLRGQFGKLVRDRSEGLYEQLFAPPRRSGGPSGLADPPRPYVLRGRENEGRSFLTGEGIGFAVHLFDRTLPGAFAEVAWEPVVVSLERDRKVQRMRLHLCSPTELKGVRGVEFPALVARLRDRVSTLGQMYGGGPLKGEFGEWVERAERVKVLRQELEWVGERRRSRATGQSHGIGGWKGMLELEGELSELYPLLAAGRWTGVGRHTVWGNGELLAEVIE